MPGVTENIFADLPVKPDAEILTQLLSAPNLRIERIVSTGQATPVGHWCDQDWAEWVLVLQGSAALKFEGQAAPVLLAAGDYLHIPPHTRHRVEWTDAARPTIWLAVHYGR
jgi:cupin 2 domain-containing protein